MAVLWNSFKARLGVSENLVMHFDLPSLVFSVDPSIITDLDRTFAKEEID